jgi:hypothetical protein
VVVSIWEVVDTTCVRRKRLSLFREGIHLVGEDVIDECSYDGKVKPDQQLLQGLAFMAYKHGEGVAAFGVYGDTTGRLDESDGDLSMCDQILDMSQRGRIRRGVLAPIILV